MSGFNQLQKNRKEFMAKYKDLDHFVFNGRKQVLISAPHGVSQIRLGKYKVGEIGSLCTALYLQKECSTFMIAKTKNNNDDANFDKNCKYKNEVISLIQKHNIKYVLDFHGLAEYRECDVNLGIHLGKSVETNLDKFNSLCDKLNEDFKVSIDAPFMGGGNTISNYVKHHFPELWTIQIEINCGLTNKKENFEKYKLLLEKLQKWIDEDLVC
jgi:hypothetical protein